MGKKAIAMGLSEKFVKKFNLGLIVLFCFLLLSILFLKVSKPKSIDQILSFGQQTAADLPVLNLTKKSSKYYQRILGRRELFVAQPGTKNKKTAPAASFEDSSSSSDLQLLGIISGVSGPQAIIADSKSGKSFYCSGGEKINDFTVIEVLESKVILERDEEKVELKL